MLAYLVIFPVFSSPAPLCLLIHLLAPHDLAWTSPYFPQNNKTRCGPDIEHLKPLILIFPDNMSISSTSYLSSSPTRSTNSNSKKNSNKLLWQSRSLETAKLTLSPFFLPRPENLSSTVNKITFTFVLSLFLFNLSTWGYLTNNVRCFFKCIAYLLLQINKMNVV